MQHNSNNSANNNRIAKNTLLLYIRMLLLMTVSLYTSRVVLEVLGVEDYGIYNVVGGVVAMFTVISGSLSGAISRFITFELGKGNQEKLNKIFSTSVIIQILIGLLIAVLVETVGVWFLSNKMVIPADRLEAANWVLQFSLVTLIINLLSIPYNATIIAHERMGAFAYISIIEVICKLAIAYFITISPIDKLTFYAILMAVVSLIIRFIYSLYCRRNFEECKFRRVFDKQLLKEMFSFAGWNYIGSFSGLCRDQGGAIVLNMLGGGPVVNAARGISTQVSAAVTQFSINLMMALNPQIIKSYANGNRSYMMTLIFQGSRFSYYMLLALSLPVLFNTEYILTVWLKEVPAHTVIFVQLSLVFMMIESISSPLITAMSATGEIRNYQIVVGGLQIMNLPLSYILLKIGMGPEIVLIVAIFISICCLCARLIMLRPMINLSVRKFFVEVITKVATVSLLSALIPFLVAYYASNSDLMSFVGISIICLLTTAISIYFVGCSQTERQFVKTKIRQSLNFINNDRNKS